MARDRRRSSAPEPSPEELAAALAQFNTGVRTSRDLERHEKAVAKADRRRMEAAAKMKQLLDGDAPAEERAAADAEYREAVEAWQQLVSSTGAEPQPEGAGEAEKEGSAPPIDPEAPAAVETATEGAEVTTSGEVDGETASL